MSAQPYAKVETIYPCSEQHYSQQPEGGSNPAVHGQRNGKTERGRDVQCNTFTQKKEENSDTRFNTNLEDIMLHEISQPQKNKYCMIPLI